ncbi:MAG TPA: DUF4337 domain-containing protein [Polyangia bacterium]|nr:DUF4337 domain-containing protein [Polyangia bacterium]
MTALPQPPPTETEIQELLRSIAEERRGAKDKERRERWTRYVSLMVVVLAVATAIGTLKAGGFGSKVMLYQTQASDNWAFYQAKSIKQRIAEMEARGATGDAAAAAAADVARYKAEEKDLLEKAQRLESMRDGMAKHGPPMGFGIASLQIAIALASVCLITKRKSLWGVSALLGAMGITYVVYGLYFV